MKSSRTIVSQKGDVRVGHKGGKVHRVAEEYRKEVVLEQQRHEEELHEVQQK